MSILDQILSDIKLSLKQGEKDRLLCLRGIHSEIKNITINQKIELTDAIVIQSLSKEIKQRRNSIQMFKEGNRPDLVTQNQQEIEWIETYLPSTVSTEELQEIIKSVVTELGVTSKKEMGIVVKRTRSKLEGKVFDGQKLSQLIQRALS